MCVSVFVCVDMLVHMGVCTYVVCEGVYVVSCDQPLEFKTINFVQ